MSEQLVEYGTIVALKKNPNFCIATDGMYTVDCYIPANVTAEIGKTYMLTKRNNTYFLGAEIPAR